MIKLSLIIPTYNEAKNLPPLLKEIWDVLDKNKIDLEFIIVDDNSPDGTGQVAEDLAKKYPLKVIHRAGKLGLGSAVIEGFKLSDREIIGVMDADLSHDPSILNQLIGSIDNGYDIVIGSRFEEGSVVENWTISRMLISKSGVGLARLITGTKDPLSGYFFLKRQVIGGLHLKTIGYKILLEILVKGKYNKILEFPYSFRMRRFSTSKLNYKEYVLFIWQLIIYSFYTLYHLLRYGRRR
jgi:dolichol-phosphate mannosyltransferase